LAFLSNAVGLLDFATNHRLILSLVTGTLAVVVGGFWLVRLFMAGESGRIDTAMFAVNLAIYTSRRGSPVRRAPMSSPRSSLRRGSRGDPERT